MPCWTVRSHAHTHSPSAETTSTTALSQLDVGRRITRSCTKRRTVVDHHNNAATHRCSESTEKGSGCCNCNSPNEPSYCKTETQAGGASTTAANDGHGQEAAASCAAATSATRAASTTSGAGAGTASAASAASAASGAGCAGINTTAQIYCVASWCSTATGSHTATLQLCTDDVNRWYSTRPRAATDAASRNAAACQDSPNGAFH